MSTKKFVSAALTATTAVWLSGATLLVPAAQAQSAEALQAQIAALLAQIQQLQAQLNSGSSGGSSSYSFTRDLTVGSSGSDVSSLQQVLISKGYLKIAAPTGYFGSLTKAAVAAWQAASGISPAAGYFGPKSRAAMNSMGGGPGPTPGPGPVPAPSSGLAVSAAFDNPAAGALISSSGSSAARVPVLKVNLTAGSSGGVTVNQLVFHKVGAFSDSNISNAYLVENGRVIGQYNSLSQGKITFSGLSLGVNAGQTRSVTLAIDPATGLTAGNTVSFSMTMASDVSAVDYNNTAITPSGLFPINGNVFTVTSVSNPSIASLTISSSSVGTTVYAGTTNVLVSQWTLTGANSPVNLSSINFKVIGGATKSDIKNLRLLVNGTQVGTLAQVSADGNAYFDLSAAPVKINTGSSNMQVYADVMGSPSLKFTFELLNTYDVLAVDTQYNTPVGVTINGGTGVEVTINQGAATISLASDTPTGTVSKGGSGTTLAKFTIYAAGEPLKVKWLGFQIVYTGVSTNGQDSELKNVNLIDDAGNQVGSTITSMTTSATCTDTAYSNATGTASNCFGNSSSPINYIVPANTTRVLSLRGDIQTTAQMTAIQAKLTGNTNNLQGQTSSQSASSGGASGSTLTVSSASLTVAKNSGVGNQTFAAGAVGVKIGSYTLTASTAEGANLTSITILGGANLGSYQNMKLMVGGTQFGQTQSTLTNTSYTFSGGTLNIPAGTTKVVDVVADVLSGTAAGTHATITTLSGCSGSGASTYSSVTCTSTAGQSTVIAGQASVQISADTSAVPGTQVVSGQTGVSLAAFRFLETSNIEDVKVTDLNIFQSLTTTSTVKTSFSQLYLYNGATLLGTSGSANASVNSTTTGNSSGYGYYWPFHFSSPIVVPKSNSVLLTLKGDVSSYGASGITDNSTHAFKIASSTDSANDTIPETVVALGNTSNATTSVTLNSAAGNNMTVLRTKLSFAGTGLGVTSGRAKSASDAFASLTFTADSAGDVAINSVIVTFSGTAPSATAFLDGVTLVDENGSNLGTNNTTSSTACSGANTCAKTFNLGTTTGGQVVTRGTSRTWTLKIDETKTQTGVNGISQSLSATINALTDLRYTDGLDAQAQTTISLPSNITVPILINSVSFAAGS